MTWLSPDEALDRFVGVASGLVIIDPAIPASINVATMLAGIRGWLVATPALARSPRLAQWVATTGAPTLDLADLQWKSDAEAYHCVYDRYFDDLSHAMCAMTDPYDLPFATTWSSSRSRFSGSSTRISRCRPGPEMPQRKGPALRRWAPKRPWPKRSSMRLPPNIPCLGWPYAPLRADEGLGEHRGVILANEEFSVRRDPLPGKAARPN